MKQKNTKYTLQISSADAHFYFTKYYETSSLVLAVCMVYSKNGWVWSQNRVKSEGYEKWNKGKYKRNQQWAEGNWDLNEWCGPEGKK